MSSILLLKAQVSVTQGCRLWAWPAGRWRWAWSKWAWLSGRGTRVYTALRGWLGVVTGIECGLDWGRSSYITSSLHTNARSPAKQPWSCVETYVLVYGPQPMPEPPHHLLLRENPDCFNPPIPKLFRQPRQPKRGSNRPPPPIVAFFAWNFVASYISLDENRIFNARNI